MIAFLIAGLILGVLARVLRNGPDDPSPVLAVVTGVAGALIGGCGLNLVLGNRLASLDAWSFTGACILALVLLGLLEGRVGREPE